MNSSQMDWEHIGTTRIEQFVEQADAEAHDDKHNDKQKKMEAKEVVTTMVSSAPAAAREAISNLEEEDEGKANIKESEVKSAAAAAHKSEKTARVRPSVLRVLAVFVVTILALGVLALGMVVQKSRRSEALDAVDQLRTRVEALEQAAADLQRHHHRHRPDNIGRERPRSRSPRDSALELAESDAHRMVELAPFVRDPWASALNVQQALLQYLLHPSIEFDDAISSARRVISDVAHPHPSSPASNACSRGTGPVRGALNGARAAKAQSPKHVRIDEAVASAAAAAKVSHPHEADPSPPASSSTTEARDHKAPVAPSSAPAMQKTDAPRFDGGGAPARNVDPRAAGEPGQTRDVVRKLRSLSTKQLRAMLHAHGKECKTCVEKDDLVGRVLAVIENS